jgi:hypothetical protein
MDLLEKLLTPSDPLEEQGSTGPEQVKLEPSSQVDLAWKLMVELRKELVETQRIRSQVLGVKITFVSAGIGVIAANIADVPIQLLVIPALAAIFFDLLINSYGFSIKRIGYYCRRYIEPHLKKAFENPDSPDEMSLWEEFLVQDEWRQSLGMWGNLGLTGLAIILAVIALLSDFEGMFSVPLLIAMAVFLLCDVVTAVRTDRVGQLETADQGVTRQDQQTGRTPHDERR